MNFWLRRLTWVLGSITRTEILYDSSWQFVLVSRHHRHHYTAQREQLCATRRRCKAVITSTQLNSKTGPFSDHSASGLGSCGHWTDQLSWNELSRVGSGDVITQLSWTKIASFLSVVKFSTCSELYDCQQTGDFFLELSCVKFSGTERCDHGLRNHGLNDFTQFYILVFL